MQVQCELGREQPEPLSLAPHPHLSVRSSRPNPRALPAAPSAAQSTSARGALRRAATPIPGRPLSNPFPMPWPPLSAPPSPLCGTLSLQDFQPASPPSRESRSPNTEAAGGLRPPKSTPLCSPRSLCLSSFLSSFPQPSSLPLPPDLPIPFSASCSPRGYLLVSNPHPLFALFSSSSPEPPNPMSPSCFSLLLPVFPVSSFFLAQSPHLLLFCLSCFSVSLFPRPRSLLPLPL